MTKDRDNLADHGDFVRPFLMSAGRTKAAVEGLQYETLLHATDKPADSLRFEPARVYALCVDETVAIAEISASLSLPIGTVKVVVGDLIQSGHLSLHETIDATQTEDIELISRLIDGVRRL